jgi:transcriptional regulator with XRE-family HTH domain
MKSDALGVIFGASGEVTGMADLPATIGAVIRRIRQERSRTLKRVAKAAGLSVVYLGEIERGKKYPSAAVLERLAAALGLELADLLELIADDLRAAAVPTHQDVIGFAPPSRSTVTARATGEPQMGILRPDIVPKMAA